MQMPQTEAFLKKGIKLQKLLQAASYGGLFGSSSPAVWDHKTVFDLEEALDLTNNHGWMFSNTDLTFNNLALYMWRDLKKHGEPDNLPGQ